MLSQFITDAIHVGYLREDIYLSIQSSDINYKSFIRQ